MSLASALIWCGTMLRPPVLVSLSLDLVDTAGGDSVTATLDAVIGTPTVTVGGTSATVTAYDGTSVDFDMPTKSAGPHDVVVTTAGGASNALSIEAFGWSSPSSATLAHLLMPYVSASVTLAGAKVSALADLVGGLHQSQSTDANRPTLATSDSNYGGKDTLSCSSSFFSSSLVSAIATPVNLLVIGHLTADSKSLLAYASGGVENMLWRKATNLAEYYSRSSGGTVTRTTESLGGRIGSPGAILVTDDGTNNKLYTNDLATPRASVASHWKSCTWLALGQGSSGVGTATGTIAGAAIYTGGELSAGDRTKLAKLTKIKFGLTNVMG